MSKGSLIELRPFKTESPQENPSALPASGFAPKVFGVRFCPFDPQKVAALILARAQRPIRPPMIVATANIQHIAEMRTNAEFKSAMLGADLVTCDGFPVYRYARARGWQGMTRTTGREIVQIIMSSPAFAERQRPFFVVDCKRTADHLSSWADRNGLADRIQIEIPPMGFIGNDHYCLSLAKRVRTHRATMLFLCVGAPRSEIFAHRYRHLLPACWVLCVGQAVKIVLGLSPTPPRIIGTLNTEWLWRIVLEPRRLLGRYVRSALGFALAVFDDLRKGAAGDASI